MLPCNAQMREICISMIHYFNITAASVQHCNYQQPQLWHLAFHESTKFCGNAYVLQNHHFADRILPTTSHYSSQFLSFSSCPTWPSCVSMMLHEENAYCSCHLSKTGTGQSCNHRQCKSWRRRNALTKLRTPILRWIVTHLLHLCTTPQNASFAHS